MKNITAKLTIDETKAIPANPLIFGHFIEFMRDCINEGMWAQLLKNRGFDLRKPIPEGVVDGNPNVAAHWHRTGYKNSFTITLDAGNSLARNGYSQKIVCFNDYDGYVGIGQDQLCLEKAEYQGYIWVKAQEKAAFQICIHAHGQCIYQTQEWVVGPDWQRRDFSFKVDKETGNACLEIRLLGEGTLWLDGASLMPCDTVDGIWREVYEHIIALKPPVIRFPGGCFADCYHWEDGIGARESRPYLPNRHWGGYEDNSFGTDEYMEFCKRVGCEPMICVNFGSGTPQEAANWVEYCNGSADTPYGRLRAENGHPEPYGIRYWDIGNEIFGDWEIGHCSAREYGEKYLQFYQAMREKDDSIIFMICGGDGDNRSQEWNRQIAEIIGENMDSVCLHMYVLKDMEGRKHDNEAIYYAVTGAVKKYEEILVDSYETVRKGNPKAKVAVTEYNMGTLIDSYREQTLEAAIFNAGMLQMFLRHSEKLTMCNISDLVNGWPGGVIVSKNGHAYGTASYYVMKLYADSGIRKVLGSSLEGPAYSVNEPIGNIEPIKDIAYADVVVCRDGEGELVIFAVNRSIKEELCLLAGLDGIRAEITEIYSEKTSDMNDGKTLSVLPVTRKETVGQEGIILKPHSINRIRCIRRAGSL